MGRGAAERGLVSAAGQTGGAVALALLLTAGCKTTKPREPMPSAPPSSTSAPAPFWADPANPTAPPVASIPGNRGGVPTGGTDPTRGVGNDPEVSGILAGRLLDGASRPPATAYIQVTAVGDTSVNAAPIEVETVNQGHFYIRGLQPGRTYELVARARVDGRVLVGRVQAQPPDVKILIPLSEDLNSAATPPIPGSPAGLPQRAKAAPTVPQAPPTVPQAPPPTQPAAAWTGVSDTASAPAAELLPPRGASAPPNIAIPTSETHWSAPSIVPPSPAPLGGPVTCKLAGNRVVELSCPDADGTPWDLGQRRGNLLLIDFWGTWCMPCLKAIPEVSRLNNVYGPRGLEVIGIACENGSAADNRRRVQDVRSKIHALTYRVLIAGEPGTDPVRRAFRLQSYPTLVLIDTDGTILWQGNPSQDRELETILKGRLR